MSLSLNQIVMVVLECFLTNFDIIVYFYNDMQSFPLKQTMCYNEPRL